MLPATTVAGNHGLPLGVVVMACSGQGHLVCGCLSSEATKKPPVLPETLAGVHWVVVVPLFGSAKNTRL